jgi:uncharacterized protein YndB with AHSA1/START domain
MNSPSRKHPSLNGDVTYDGEFTRLFYQRRLPHPPERVWAALTDPEQLGKWFMATSVAMDGRPGGSLEMVAGPGRIRSHGRILAWEPPRLLEYEWITRARSEIPSGEDSFVKWELTPVEGETLLTLEHRRLTRPTAAGFAPGWHAFMDRLTAQLSGEPLPDWIGRFNEARGAYPGWEEKEPGVLRPG